MPISAASDTFPSRFQLTAGGTICRLWGRAAALHVRSTVSGRLFPQAGLGYLQGWALSWFRMFTTIHTFKKSLHFLSSHQFIVHEHKKIFHEEQRTDMCINEPILLFVAKMPLDVHH